MQNPTQSKTVLAITPSRRAIGAALADRLGIVDVDLLNLHDVEDEKRLAVVVEHWLTCILSDCKPVHVIVENIDPRRMNPESKIILESLRRILPAAHTTSIHRRDAVRAVSESTRRNLRLDLRVLARRLAVQSPLLALHQPPNSFLRSDWDRSWGQVSAACALALYARRKYLK